MAARSNFRGFGELSAKLGALRDDKEIGKVLATGVRQALAPVKAKAKQLIPTGIDPHKSYKGRTLVPGFARRSIRSIVRTDRTKHKVTGRVGVRAEAFYAVQYVELGTVKMSPHPWLRPAFLSSEHAQIQALGDQLRAWIVGLAARHRSAGNEARAQTLESGLD